MKLSIPLVAILSLAFARHHESHQERLARIHASKEANKHIKHVDHEEIQVFLKTGLKILFFGARWCKYTQHFDPKYLAATRKLEEMGYNHYNYPFFDISKVECSHNEDFCRYTHKIEEGYPTINVFIDGKFVEEYPGADEIEPFIAYVTKKVDEHKSREEAKLGVPVAETRPETKPEETKPKTETAQEPEAPVKQPSKETGDSTKIDTKLQGGFSPLFIAACVFAVIIAIICYRAFMKRGAKSGRYTKVDLSE